MDFSQDYIAKVAKGDLTGEANEQYVPSPDMGTATNEDIAAQNEIAANTPFTDYVKKGFQGTAPVAVYDLADRKLTAPDPNFNVQDNFKQIMDGLPEQYWPSFGGVRSMNEAMLLKAQLQSELKDQQLMSHAGFEGQVGYAIGGLADPINLLAGGAGSGVKLAKIGLAGTRIEAAAKLAVGGTKVGTIEGSLNAATRPTGQFKDVVDAGLSGGAFGLLSGLALPGLALHDNVTTKLDESLDKTRTQFKDTYESGQAGTKVYDDTATTTDTTFDTTAHKETAVTSLEQQLADLEVQHDKIMTEGGDTSAMKSQMMEVADKRIAELKRQAQDFSSDSVGAASLNKAGQANLEGLSDAVINMRKEAQAYNARNGVGIAEENAFPDTGYGKAAKYMYEQIKKSPLAADFDKLYNSNSPIASALAHKLYESPIGILRNNKSASMLHDIYLNNIAHDVNFNYPKTFNKWAAEKKLPVSNAIAYSTPMYRRAFEKEVHMELQSRLHDGTGATQSSAIKEMADHIDNSSQAAASILQGRAGEASVKGAEDLKPKSGWFPQRYSSSKLNAVLSELKGKVPDPKETLADTLAKQYQSLHGWKYDDALVFAKAVMRRAVAKSDGIDTSLLRMLDSEGSEYMTKFMLDNGFSKEKTESLINALKGINSERNKENFLKSRVDMDMRTQIPGTDKTLMDIMDTDIPTVWNSYARRASGSAALARQGIQKSNLHAIFDAIKADETANGGRTLPDSFFEGVESHFRGGAVGQGVNEWVRRGQQLTNLSILNGLGLTQLAETGVNVAALGLDVFKKTARKEVQQLISGKGDVQAMKDLSKWLSPIEGEHMTQRPDILFDEMRKDPGQYSELGNHLDRILAKGSRIQGHVTGFYYVHQLQQRIAIRGMMHKLGQFYKEGKLISDARLEDMGLDAATSARIGKYFKDGTIEFESDGGVKDLHVDKWNPSDLEDFAVVLNRFTHQVVQRAMKGEDSIWMHSTLGAMFSHLKMFTLTSLQKQLLRNMRITDPTSMTSFFYGLASAAAIYAARQGLNGNTKNLDPVSIARGAMALSNMTSIVPSFVDPIASMFGMEDYRLGKYGNDNNFSVLPVPPMFPTLNRLAKAPVALGKILTGTNSNSDIYSAQAIPIVGNLVGMSNIWNLARTDKAVAKQSKPQVASKQEPVKQEVAKPTQYTSSNPVKKGKEVLKDLGVQQ